MRIKFSFKKFSLFLLFQIVFAGIVLPFLIFWGPFVNLKALVVASVVTSRHPQFARLFLSQAEIDAIMKKQEQQVTAYAADGQVEHSQVSSVNGITIENISGYNWKGKVMLISDPNRVQVATTAQLGDSGERVSDIATRIGAVAAINAGGFSDPNGKGNGGFPTGITVHADKIVYDDSHNQAQDMVGIDNSGKLIFASMTSSEVLAKGIKEAVSFGPELVDHGQGTITRGDGGWGISPRTAIGQKPDGTIIFVVIDGRQLHSLGATLLDLQNVFLKYGAETAVNLDGGSSATMFYNGQVINKPADIFGERYVPTAFIVK